jgi:predicted TPR repeat methyltransferase
MLEIAAQINPEIEYIEGDMRIVRLNRKFDAVAIPDSIMYMSTLSDFSAAIQTAAEHLKPQGYCWSLPTPKSSTKTIIFLPQFQQFDFFRRSVIALFGRTGSIDSFDPTIK